MFIPIVRPLEWSWPLEEGFMREDWVAGILLLLGFVILNVIAETSYFLEVNRLKELLKELILFEDRPYLESSFDFMSS